MGRKAGLSFDQSPPEDFDPADPYKDPIAMIEMREYLTREKFIKVEMAKVLRDKVRDCYRREGVNHKHKCKKWVDRYMDAIKETRWNRGNRIYTSADLKPATTS